MSVYVLPKFLSPIECDEVRSMFASAQNAQVNTVDGEREQKKILRSGRVTFLGDDTFTKRVLKKRIKDMLANANQATGLHFDIVDTEPLQLAEYAVGDGYGWHLDIGPGPGNASLRKLSASIQISASHEYDGGDLELWGSSSVDREKGTLIVFPSYLLHRVAPVTRGVRFSLVAWAIGTSSFR